MIFNPDYEPKLAWAKVCIFAWKNSEVLNELRKDPKRTIIEIADDKNGKYKDNIARYARIIRSQTEEDPSDKYRGYLPIPNPLSQELKTLSRENLKTLLENGLTGVLRFDVEADIWAEVFFKAWQDPELQLLKEIRQNPFGGISKALGEDLATKLRDSTYGIFPMPDLPSSLSGASIEQLEKLSEELENITGIFPLALT